LETNGIHVWVNDGDQLKIDIRNGEVENLTTGKRLQGRPPSRFLLEMLESGGLIPMLKSGAFPGSASR
jgi:3-isopropylmalate/(R)-2-methylmalate dehydratase small subunit